MSRYDLIVAGGGLAGTASAITAARLGARVLLLERGRFPRHKVCGEFVSGEAFALLANLLGPDQQALLALAPRTTEARLFVDGAVVRFPIVPAASIPRYELDAALWRAAEAAGVDCRQAVTVECIARCGDMFEVSTTAGSYVARSAIDATGRWSRLTADRGLKDDTQPKWLGLKAHFKPSIQNQTEPLTTDLYFFSGGYCGVQPLEDCEVNVCAVVRADIASKLDDVFTQHPALQERSQRWVRVTDVIATAPIIFRAPQPEYDGVLCAGDAAAFIDPFVGDGISMALRSGAVAGEALEVVWRGEASLKAAAESYRDEYRNHFARTLRTARRLRKLLEAPTLFRRVAVRVMRVPVVAAYIVAHTR